MTISGEQALPGADGFGGARSTFNRTLSRRRLIAAASASAIALALTNAPAAPKAPPVAGYATTFATRISRLSAGYLEGSGNLPSLKTAPWDGATAGQLRVHPATHVSAPVLSGDPVTMRVHGLYPGVAPTRFGPGATAVLTVLYPSTDAGHPEPYAFHAWQGTLAPGATGAPPVSFPVPLDASGNLALRLDIFQPGAAAPFETMTATFGTTGGQPLHRGIYFLGFTPTAFHTTRTLQAGPGARASLVVSFDG